MAQRRMFSKSITNSSKFIMMPQSSRLLYYDLGMNADDDGFCEHFVIMKMTDASPDDLKILQAKELVQVFDDKVLVIRDWKENNYIQKDRYTQSKYLEVYGQELKLPLTNKDGDENKLDTKCIQKNNKMDTQVRLGKVRLGKVRVKDNTEVLDKSAPQKIEYGNPLINLFIRTLEELNGLSSLDGTIRDNRRFANLFIKGKLKPEFMSCQNNEPSDDELIASLKAIVNKADKWHRPKITNFKYLYYNFGTILQEVKKSQIIKL